MFLAELGTLAGEAWERLTPGPGKEGGKMAFYKRKHRRKNMEKNVETLLSTKRKSNAIHKKGESVRPAQGERGKPMIKLEGWGLSSWS